LRTRTRASFLSATLLLCLSFSPAAHAQAGPTATQTFQIAAFAGATGTLIGLDQGRNTGITAGGDLGFRSFYRLHPFLEVRGTYPVDNGSVAGLKNVLIGVKIEKRIARAHLYGDAFFGRGEINYNSPGYLNPAGKSFYLQSLSNIYSFGGGVDLDLTHHYALKADAQLQHYSVPVTTSGSIYAKAFTLAVVYRFDFNHHPKHNDRQ
jgi:hypothetical protein